MDESPAGIVLVGGESRRMGADKALIQWEGQPLAAHMAGILYEVCPRVVLVGGAGRGYERLGWPWWPDPPELAGRGPMAGLVAALTRLPDVLLVACDLPYLTPIVLRRFLEASRRGAPAAMPVVAGRPEPLVGRYRQPVLPIARASIDRGSGRMKDLCPLSDMIPASSLGTVEEVALAFRNVNDIRDLRASRGAGADPG